MTSRSEDWRRKEVFNGARALPADARLAMWDAACGNDHALRHAVETLLVSYERAELGVPAVLPFDSSFAPAPQHEPGPRPTLTSELVDTASRARSAKAGWAWSTPRTMSGWTGVWL